MENKKNVVFDGPFGFTGWPGFSAGQFMAFLHSTVRLMFPFEVRKQVRPSQIVISRDFAIVMVNFFMPG